MLARAVYDAADHALWREHREGLLREARRRGLARASKAADKGKGSSFEKPSRGTFQVSVGGWVLRLQKLSAGDPIETPKTGR